MSRVVFVGWDAQGHINPTLALVKELVQSGEEVYYFSNNCRDLIEATGCYYLESKYLKVLYNSFGLKLKKTSEEEFLNHVERYYERLEYLFALLERFKNELLKLNPDYIIHDSGLGFIKYMCKELKIPCISSVTMLVLNRDIFLKDEDLFANLYNIKIDSNVRSIIEKVDRIAEKYQYKYGYFHDYFDNFLGKEDLNLVYTSFEFQPYKECIDNTFCFIGNDISHRKSIESVQGLSISTKRKTILLSFGSILSGSEKYIDYYKGFMEYFATFNMNFIINIGELSKELFDNVPENFVLLNGINQLSLLEFVDLFITHGGMNSVSESILFNTPMIVIPQTTDQFAVAKQVEKLGLGIQINKLNTDFHAIEKRIDEVLNNKEFVNNIKLISKSYKDTGEVKAAVERIFKYLNNC